MRRQPAEAFRCLERLPFGHMNELLARRPQDAWAATILHQAS